MRKLITVIILFHISGYTDDVCKYIRASVPKTMLADLKDSVKSNRSVNIQDKYGATAVSLCFIMYKCNYNIIMFSSCGSNRTGC